MIFLAAFLLLLAPQAPSTPGAGPAGSPGPPLRRRAHGSRHGRSASPFALRHHRSRAPPQPRPRPGRAGRALGARGAAGGDGRRAAAPVRPPLRRAPEAQPGGLRVLRLPRHRRIPWWGRSTCSTPGCSSPRSSTSRACRRRARKGSAWRPRAGPTRTRASSSCSSPAASTSGPWPSRAGSRWRGRKRRRQRALHKLAVDRKAAGMVPGVDVLRAGGRAALARAARDRRARRVGAEPSWTWPAPSASPRAGDPAHGRHAAARVPAPHDRAESRHGLRAAVRLEGGSGARARGGGVPAVRARRGAARR